MKMEPEATGDATTLDEECADELTKTDGRVQLRSDLLEALEAITMRLPDVSDSRNGVDIELLSKNVARLTAKLKHANEGYGEPVSVAIVGSNRRGKSHFLNSTLAITEVSSQLYNCSPFENSDDAAHVAARMCFDSGPLTLSADGPTMSADDPTSPTRDEGSLFEHLRERIHAVDMSTADDRERKPCPSGQVQRQPHGPQLGAGEMPCPEDDFCTVVWMLPKQGPHEWTDFDVDGRLRHTRSPFDDHYITVGKVDAMYADYISGKDHPDPNVRPSPSEFLLPSNGSGKSVTSHNTYVWGGERYTLILKYTSAEKIDNLIGNLIATADGDDSYKSALKKTLVEILHILKDGVSPADASEEDRVRFDNKRDNYINRWAKIKSMKELQDDEWGPMQWWKMTGRVRHYSNAGAVVHSGIHQSVRDTFGKIYIYQGAGKHALDDRMYIKATLAKLLDPADAASRLVEEVHVTAPSTELTRHTALVDTPGTNDVDPVKFVQLREAAARATGFLVFAATALSAATDTMNALCDHGIIDRAIKRYVTGAMDQPGSTSSSDEILFVECSARHSGMNLMPRAIQGTENPKSLLSKTAKDARKITVSDQEESIKNLVLNRAHDTVRAGGSIGDASFSLPTGMSGEDKEIAEDELRDRIRHNIAIPLSKDRSHNMNVAVCRGMVKSPLHEKWMRDCRAETGGDAVMTALRKMLRGIVSAVEVRKLADQCSTVHEIVIAPATEPVPDYVRKKAQSLHDNRMTSPAQLKTSIWDTITSEMKNLWAPDGTPVGSVDWVAGVTDELLMALTGVTEVFRDLSAGRSGALENAAQSDVRADFDRCAKGQLFQKAGKMSRIAFGLCRTAFKADELWEAAFASPIKAALEKLLKDVFEPHCCNSLLGGDDASPVSSQATASVVSAIRTAFNVRKRLNNVQAEFFKDTKHFAQTFGPLARTLPRDSLPQRVLERLFKKLFENYIHADSQKVNRDPFGNGTRDNAEAKQELMDIFAKEHLQSNVTRQHLREVVRDELSKLTDKVGVSLRSLFLTLRRRRGVMNPSMDARRTNIIIKETMGHVASCKGVAADDGLMKVKDFKAACGKILRIAHDYEELDRHDDDVNQFGNRKQQAVGALDKLLEEKPQLKDMTLKDEFKAEMRMSSLRWPDADQNWCVDWPDLPKDESSFHEIGTGDRLPDSTRESKIIDVLPDGIKDRAIRQGYTLIHSPMLDEGKGICSARCVLFSTLADAIEIRKEENPAAFRKDFCRAMELHMNTIGITVSDFRACLTETLNMKHVGAHLELYFLGSKKGFKRAPRFDRRRVVRLVWDEELKCLSVLVIHKRQHRVQTPDPGTGETHHELDPTKHESYMKEKSAAKTYYSGLVKYNRDNGGPGARLGRAIAAGEMTAQPAGPHGSTQAHRRDVANAQGDKHLLDPRQLRRKQQEQQGQQGQQERVARKRLRSRSPSPSSGRDSMAPMAAEFGLPQAALPSLAAASPSGLASSVSQASSSQGSQSAQLAPALRRSPGTSTSTAQSHRGSSASSQGISRSFPAPAALFRSSRSPSPATATNKRSRSPSPAVSRQGRSPRFEKLQKQAARASPGPVAKKARTASACTFRGKKVAGCQEIPVQGEGYCDLHLCKKCKGQKSRQAPQFCDDCAE